MDTRNAFVEVGKARLYAEVAGRGQPIVLIHAGVADSRQWNNEFAAFANEGKVLRYDLRGYGKSLPVEGEFRHIDDLSAVLDGVGFSEPGVLIGCSMGGGLAMDFALANPSRVRGLVMVGSGPSGLELDVPSHPKMAEAEAAYNAGDRDRLADIETEIWFDGMGRAAADVDPEMRALAREMNRLVIEHEFKKLGKRVRDAQTPATERLGELKIPVLILVGEHDLPYMHAAGDYMLKHLPSARKVVLEDAAHLPNMDHPEEFQHEVRRFLKDLRV